MSTGNPVRDKLLATAILQCIAADEGPTYGNVAQKLEMLDGFDLLDTELEEAIAELKHAGGGDLPVIVSPEPLDKIEAPRASEPTTPHNPPANTTIERNMTREQSQARVEAAHAALGGARVAVKIAQQKLADSKGALANAILAWQMAADPLTPEERRERETRNAIEASNEVRADRRNATAQTAKQFAQKIMRNGPSRGAYSMQQAARVGFKVPRS